MFNKLITIAQQHNKIAEWTELEQIKPHPDVGAVVVGFDRRINYLKTSYAYHCLQKKECLFIATNLDPTFPTGNSLFPGYHNNLLIVLGGGTMVAPLVTSTGRQPTVVGKPKTWLLEHMIKSYIF